MAKSHTHRDTRIMSDRFVSGGTIGSSSGELSGPSQHQHGDGNGTSTTAAAATADDVNGRRKNAEWEAVQKELEADRQRREEQRRKDVEGEEKSLYEILQANKGKMISPLSASFPPQPFFTW